MFKAGYCGCDITPLNGAPMGAFPSNRGKGIPRCSEGANDPLKASSLTLTDGKETLVVCSSDTCLFQTEDVFEIREKAARRCGVPAENIMICSTHTHSSGENAYLFGGKPTDKWPCELKDKLVDIISDSFENTAPAKVFFTQIEAPFNHNRRTIQDGNSTMVYDRTEGLTTGPVDPMLSLMRVDISGGPSVFWTNWTAHALTTGGANLMFTADYPGVLNSMIESAFPGAQAFFTNGCAGNVHPMKSMKEGFETGKEIGAKLFEKVREAARNMKELESGLKVNSEIFKLKHRKTGQDIGLVLACADIGGIKAGFLPGEPYVEFQLAFREAFAPEPSFVNGYSNGWNGYLPTEKAFEEGGYGVQYFEELSDVPYYYGRTQINPGDGELILEKLIELAKR